MGKKLRVKPFQTVWETEAESKYMPHSKKRFEKVEKEASVAEQQGMRGYQKQENILQKAGVVSR